MPTHGGLATSGERYGGGKPRVARILASLNRQRGTAYDTSVESNVYAINLAHARALDEAWAVNTRLANLWDPWRTSLVERWERLFGIIPFSNDTMTVRRARLARRFARVGRMPTAQAIADELRAELGPFFYAIEMTTAAAAVRHWPLENPSTLTPWYSTAAHLLVRMQKPSGYTEGDFIEATGKVATVLEPMIPAWVTFSWYRPGPVFVPLTGSASAAGFYLDEVNVDFEIFDS